MYADDIITIHQIKNVVIQRTLQYDVDNISKWCKLNNMGINPKKTTCMVIGLENKFKSKPSLDINIEGTCLSQTKSQKLLGIYLDENLKWTVQIKHVCNKLQKQIALLKHISYSLSAEMKEMSRVTTKPT
jgi:hypothetical protein